jgi:hypothetical protein
MALVLEDGTGIDGANTYNLVEDADAFFQDRNIPNWAGDTATDLDKAGFLVQAADFLNTFFPIRGEPLLTGQSMGFPTLAFDGVPIGVRQAQCYLAREAALNGPLAETLGAQLVTYERKQLAGVGEKEVHYDKNSLDPMSRTGSIVLGLLRPYTTQTSSIQQARVDYA